MTHLVKYYELTYLVKNENGINQSNTTKLFPSLEALGRFCDRHFKDDHLCVVSIKEVYNILNMNNPDDCKWFAKNIRDNHYATMVQSFGKSAMEKAAVRQPIVVKAPVQPGVLKQAEFNFDGAEVSIKGVSPQLGDDNYEDKYNPTRQKIGAKGGYAAKGHHKSYTDRRKPGTVNIKDKSVSEMRLYWRWCKACQRAVKCGIKKPSWETYLVIVGAKAK